MTADRRTCASSLRKLSVCAFSDAGEYQNELSPKLHEGSPITSSLKARPPLRITFALPRTGAKPIGGFKVVYEYANLLASRGHHVSILHPNLHRVDQPLWSHETRRTVRLVQRYVKTRLNRGHRPDSWFKMHPDVKMLWTPSLSERYVPDGDVIFATAWETAEWVERYGQRKGRKFYLIQHLETWYGEDERAMATWKMPLSKVVIAKWLERIATGLGEKSLFIPNGLDFSHFKVLTAPESRNPNQVLMLYHWLEWKGTAHGLQAFCLAREVIPDLTLTLFGISPQPRDLPSGVLYFHQPTQEKLNEMYNKAAIFVGPSLAEGWALTPAEALMCGAALALTDIGGHEAYGIPEETALLSPAGDPEALALNIIRLVRDQTLRLKLAHQGNEHIQQFTWKRAGTALEDALYA